MFNKCVTLFYIFYTFLLKTFLNTLYNPHSPVCAMYKSFLRSQKNKQYLIILCVCYTVRPKLGQGQCSAEDRVFLRPLTPTHKTHTISYRLTPTHTGSHRLTWLTPSHTIHTWTHPQLTTVHIVSRHLTWLTQLTPTHTMSHDSPQLTPSHVTHTDSHQLKTTHNCSHRLTPHTINSELKQQSQVKFPDKSKNMSLHLIHSRRPCRHTSSTWAQGQEIHHLSLELHHNWQP